MCLTMSGESGKDCKGVAAQKDIQAVLYFICSEIQSQWSCCKRGVQF